MSVTTSPLPQPSPLAHLAIFRARNPSYVAAYVEGPDDVETWQPRFKWRPIPVGGRTAVLSAVTALAQSGQRGFLGIVDADRARLDGHDDAAANVVVTEHHDTETDIIMSPALERILGTADEVALTALLGKQPFREALADRALPFGLLRWYFDRLGIAFPSGRLSTYNFVCRKSWLLDQQRLLREAADALGQTFDTLNDAINALRCDHSPWQVCNGHDLVALCTIALQGPLGSKKKFPQECSVSTALRLALDSKFLDGLQVWRALKCWEIANAPFQICAA